jgi:sugar phosphate isomerase/epimerase
MKLDGSGQPGHLTYCTNIHPGESWPEVAASLGRHLPEVKRRFAPDRAFGVGLRLAASAAEALSEPAALEQLKALLASNGCYVFTINGFPYGPFHGRPVKEQVYQPDWRHEARVTYSDRLADLMVALLPDDPALAGSISTVPGTFKPLAQAPGAIEEIARNLIRHVAHLVQIERDTGRTIALALEPEPYCFLETIDETVRFFEQHLFGAAAVHQLRDLTSSARGDAEEALRRHLGVCYDVCHAAVEFEDPAGSLRALQEAGIGVPKLQLSAALRVTEVGPDTAGQLRPFDEPVYLHQVVERKGDELTRYLDLPDALARIGESIGSEWRVHFHVPIFLAELKDFSTTQAFLREILDLHRKQPISQHLEVETYTWDVLPERYRQLDVASAIARELTWVREQLDA